MKKAGSAVKNKAEAFTEDMHKTAEGLKAVYENNKEDLEERIEEKKFAHEIKSQMKHGH